MVTDFSYSRKNINKNWRKRFWIIFILSHSALEHYFAKLYQHWKLWFEIVSVHFYSTQRIWHRSYIQQMYIKHQQTPTPYPDKPMFTRFKMYKKNSSSSNDDWVVHLCYNFISCVDWERKLRKRLVFKLKKISTIFTRSDVIAQNPFEWLLCVNGNLK